MEAYLLVILLLGILCILTMILGIHIYLKYFSRKFNGSYTCLYGKTVIVTGATAGIGYHTALNFAMRGARVILACRNMEKGEDTRKRIVAETGNANLVVRLINFESLSSVRSFAEEVNEEEERLDILVNNVGVFGCGKDLSEDGLLKTAQVNYFSVFLLTHLLLGKLKKSSPARIVNVASIASALARVDPDAMNAFPKIRIRLLAEFWTYIKAKLCALIFTLELGKRLEGTGVTASALHPGLVDTQMWSHSPFSRFILRHAPLVNFLSVEEGAQTTIYASVSKDVKNASGKLYDNCQETTVYRSARRGMQLVEDVWNKSEELVKLSDREKIKGSVNNFV